MHATSTGAVAVTDALAFEPGARGHDVGLDSPHVLVRTVEGLAGTVAMTTEVASRPEYGLTRSHLRRLDATSFEAYGRPVRLVATGPAAMGPRREGRPRRVHRPQGERVELRLGAVPAFPPHPRDAAHDVADLMTKADLRDTAEAWRSWVADHTTYDGEYPGLVRRGSVVLRGLTYARSGAVLAAATTRLPESDGVAGQRSRPARRGGRRADRGNTGQCAAGVLARRPDRRGLAARPPVTSRP